MSDSPSPFKLHRQQAFTELAVGQTYTYRRTFTEGDVALFCGVTGDFNPFHQDELFSQEGPFGRRIVPGLLPGSMLTHIGGMLGFLAADMQFEFLSPVFVGDTITCVVEVLEKDPVRKRAQCEARLTNQAGELTIRAKFSGFPTSPRLAADQPAFSNEH